MTQDNSGSALEKAGRIYPQNMRLQHCVIEYIEEKLKNDEVLRELFDDALNPFIVALAAPQNVSYLETADSLMEIAESYPGIHALGDKEKTQLKCLIKEGLQQAQSVDTNLGAGDVSVNAPQQQFMSGSI